jgi:spoIIIJ-associated protein
MENRQEFEGRDVEEALENARRELGRTPREGEYEIIGDAKKGFLGLGARRVKIRVASSVGAGEGAPGIGTGQREVSSPRGGQTAEKGASPDAAPYSRHEAVRALAGRVLLEMKLQLTARLRERDDAIVIELSGKDSRFLLEKNGEPLEALEHILNKILSRDERFEGRVVVDCEGQRAGRDREIVESAERAAADVRETGRPVHIDGLNSYERRLIHMAISEDKTLQTSSTGEGSKKRLTIAPAGAPRPAEGD